VEKEPAVCWLTRFTVDLGAQPKGYDLGGEIGTSISPSEDDTDDEMAMGCNLQRTLSVSISVNRESTGNSLDFGLAASARVRLSPCIRDICSTLVLNQACREQGIKKSRIREFRSLIRD